MGSALGTKPERQRWSDFSEAASYRRVTTKDKQSVSPRSDRKTPRGGSLTDVLL